MKGFLLTTPIVAVMLLLPSSLWARTIYFGSGVETVPLLAGEETILRFPTEVSSITRAQRFEFTPSNPDQPSYATLKVRPRFSTGASNVAFMLNDGTIIQTKLTIISSATPEKIDSVYEFKSKDSQIGMPGDGASSAAISELDLMKAMIRGDQVNGYQIKAVSRTVSPGFKGIATTLTRVYTGDQFNGYIFEIENKTKDKLLQINNQNLMLGDPNQAVLSNVDFQVIEPKDSGRNKTILRIVAKPTSVFSRLILPIETVQKNGDGKQ